jgi:segregation and condensation protein B
MFTKAQHHEAIRGFVKTLRPKLRLSLPALETLAVVAYKQPVTVPEIQAIRGVNAGGVIHTLLNHKLINTAGRKKVIGRPMQYKTTKEFLVQFGLNDLSELPNLKELEELSRAALGEGEETEETAAQASGTDPVSGNGAGIANGEDESTGEASGDAIEEAADEVTEEATEEATEETSLDDDSDDLADEEPEGARSPVAALGAAVGGAGIAPSPAVDDTDDDRET